jgi:hypothetical protein
VRLHEKGGKRHEMPAHHKLEAFIDEYLATAGIREDGKTPLFRAAIGKPDVLTEKPMNRVDSSGLQQLVGQPFWRIEHDNVARDVRFHDPP